MISGEQPREHALASYHGFSARHMLAFWSLLRVQRLVPRVPPRALTPALRAIGAKRIVDWSFNHYLRIAHPDFVFAGEAPSATLERAGALDGRRVAA